MADKSSKWIGIASVLLASLFLLTGGTKLLGMQVERFAAWGYPAWFQYLIGAGEVAAGTGFLMSGTRFPAAVAAIVVMLGAVFTLVRAGQPAQSAIPLATLLLAAFVAKSSRG